MKIKLYIRTAKHLYAIGASYDIPFKCEKPVPVSLTKVNPIQFWMLTSPDNKDKISKLAFLWNHETLTGSGFALAEDGTAYPVRCKKW